MKFTGSPWRPLAAICLVGCAAGLIAYRSFAADKPDPLQIDRFQSSIDAFIAADRVHPPPSGGILFIGSSIIRKWTTLSEQMAPLPAFNRGFGGSRTPEVLHYADQIALPYAPKIIVYYCGSNDINAGVKPPEIAANFRAFVEKVHGQLPKTRVFYVSIIRAPQKQDRWDWVDAANQLIKSYCASDPQLGFIDVNPAVFDRQGKARTELYLPDGLHYLPRAYVLFTAIIKPVLTQAWVERDLRGALDLPPRSSQNAVSGQARRGGRAPPFLSTCWLRWPYSFELPQWMTPNYCAATPRAAPNRLSARSCSGTLRWFITPVCAGPAAGGTWPRMSPSRSS